MGATLTASALMTTVKRHVPKSKHRELDELLRRFEGHRRKSTFKQELTLITGQKALRAALLSLLPSAEASHLRPCNMRGDSPVESSTDLA